MVTSSTQVPFGMKERSLTRVMSVCELSFTMLLCSTGSAGLTHKMLACRALQVILRQKEVQGSQRRLQRLSLH
jgi:hypothetical protein